MLNFCYLSDDNAEVLPTPKKRTKLVKKTAKHRLEKATNDIDEEVIPETLVNTVEPPYLNLQGKRKMVRNSGSSK